MRERQERPAPNPEEVKKPHRYRPGTVALCSLSCHVVKTRLARFVSVNRLLPGAHLTSTPAPEEPSPRSPPTPAPRSPLPGAHLLRPEESSPRGPGAPARPPKSQGSRAKQGGGGPQCQVTSVTLIMC